MMKCKLHTALYGISHTNSCTPYEWVHVQQCNNFIAEVPDDPDSKVHGANMGPIWGRQDPGRSQVGPMNFVIWGCLAVPLTIYHCLDINTEGIWQKTLLEHFPENKFSFYLYLHAV